MQKANLTTRTVAGFVDLLIVIGLARLPDVLGFLAASGYILIRDGLFEGRSIGKKLTGITLSSSVVEGRITYRESIIRNSTIAAAYILFLIPYAGWVLGPAALVLEWLVAVGDERGMRIGDLLAESWVVQPNPDTNPATNSSDLPSHTNESSSENQETATAIQEHSERPEHH